jgi:prepilin-type N-terminal cleavage/methylation domain-containing protein
MKKINKKYFTLPEVTMAIAILGIGMLSILGVFPVAIKSGLQAVKISESIHKARSAAHLWQTFAESTTTDLTGIKPDAYKFAFTDMTDNLYGVGATLFLKKSVKSNISNGDIDKVLNGKFQLDKVTMTVGADFTTSFYVLKPK